MNNILFLLIKFFALGDIDTLNEKYQADLYYEARWVDTINVNSLDLTSQQQSQLLNENLTIKINDLNPTIHWTPQLFIGNSIGQIGEQDKWTTIKKNIKGNFEALSPPVVKLDICEHRRVKGVFWEKLELNHVFIRIIFKDLKYFLLLFSFLLMFKI
jgi:hypothetical protein